MSNVLAIWGAVTGTTGTAIAGSSAILARRRKVAVAPACYFSVTRGEDHPQVNGAWAGIALWNVGSRQVSIERVGLRFAVEQISDTTFIGKEVEILLDEPLVLQPDSPQQRVYAPLGPLLALGLSPPHPLTAFAIGSHGKEWASPPQPFMISLPPEIPADSVGPDLAKIRDSAEPALNFDGKFVVKRERPFLPGGPVS